MFRPIAGAEVRSQHLGYLYIAGVHEFPRVFRDDIMALATQLAGGDLTAVRAAKD